MEAPATKASQVDTKVKPAGPYSVHVNSVRRELEFDEPVDTTTCRESPDLKQHVFKGYVTLLYLEELLECLERFGSRKATRDAVTRLMSRFVGKGIMYVGLTVRIISGTTLGTDVYPISQYLHALSPEDRLKALRAQAADIIGAWQYDN